MTYPYTLPDLEARFLPPSNWESNTFKNPETDHDIYYNFCLVPNAKGTIIALPGLSEFGEKYIETAHFFNNHDYNFYVIDWAYQGRSTRLKDNPHKRFSDGYESDLSDLHYLLSNIIKFNSPLYMLGHSMGGHIGLRYLHQCPDIINAAAFSAPMLGISDLKHTAKILTFLLPKLKFLFKKYIPGGKDWSEDSRINFKNDIFSNDKIRDKIHNAWSKTNPALQIGNVTFKWVYESLKSINFLNAPHVLSSISSPVLMAYADEEEIVMNDAIINASKVMPNAKLLCLENSKHEILMETDKVRAKFLNETLALFNL